MYSKFRDTKIVKKIVDELCHEDSYKQVFYRNNHEMPMPSVEILEEVMDLIRSIIFPGYFGHPDMNPDTMSYYVGASVERVVFLLSEQIKRGFCYYCDNESCFLDCEKQAQNLTTEFIRILPELRNILSTDVQAAYDGDPSTTQKGEIIYSFPGMKALLYHRVSHELLKLKIPLIPRMISEIAHEKTGIDIHPGAIVGKSFFIDHGTGTVIGATAVIGENVRIYHNVTLGAKSFPKDKNGNPVKGISRHPIIEDNVIIYSGATILGRIKIGKNAIIGANVWIMKDIKPFARIIKSSTEIDWFEEGGGI